MYDEDGRMVAGHNKALFFWQELIENKSLETPFEVVHVDSHADLGLGYLSWTHILDYLLQYPVGERFMHTRYVDCFGDSLSKKEIYEAELPHRTVAVYLYLKDRANKEGTCYPAIGNIARELHLSVSTVKRAISNLEENGFIRKKQRWRDNGGRSSLMFEIIR